jgi:hypothetical protein
LRASRTVLRVVERSGIEQIGVRQNGNYTVNDAIRDYVAWLRMHRATAEDAERRARKLILPQLGKVKVCELATPQINKWSCAGRSPCSTAHRGRRYPNTKAAPARRKKNGRARPPPTAHSPSSRRRSTLDRKEPRRCSEALSKAASRTINRARRRAERRPCLRLWSLGGRCEHVASGAAGLLLQQPELRWLVSPSQATTSNSIKSPCLIGEFATLSTIPRILELAAV